MKTFTGMFMPSSGKDTIFDKIEKGNKEITDLDLNNDAWFFLNTCSS
jgi:hypothetical protein